jgi:Ser/Thr protein kinase RdoA (MazF antagonist)
MQRRAIDAVLKSYRQTTAGDWRCRPAEKPGFSGAIVWCIETEAGRFCLRGWPVGTDDRERIRALHRLLAHVRSGGIDFVAVPVTADSGSTLVARAGRFWQLEPWLPGCADFWLSPSDARLAAACRALAHFHQVASGFPAAAGDLAHFRSASASIAPTVLDRIERFNRWTPDRLAELGQRIDQISGRRVARAQGDSDDESAVAAVADRIVTAFENSAPCVARELRAAALAPVPLQPCLRDVWHDHVLFEGDEVTGLLDPSAARADTIAADLSRLAGSLIADDRRAWDKALEAYQTVRPLSAAEVALVRVLDRSGVLLSGMAWMERSDLWRGAPPGFRPRVLERLQRIAGRAEALARSIE